MVSIYQLKPLFQKNLQGTVNQLAAIGINANRITLLSVFLSIGFGILLGVFPNKTILWLILPIFMFVRMALNAIDGMLARQFNQKSALGALLNETCDVVSDAALYLPFALLPGVHARLVMIVVLLAWLTEFIGVCAVMAGASRRYDGPMGKSDRAFVFGAIALASGLGWLSGDGPNLLLMLLILLLVLTVINRFRAALKELGL